MRFPIAASLACLLVSCDKKELTPKIEALRFPVVTLFENGSARVCKERSELMNVHTNYLKLNNEPPLLVDSEFKVYSLDHFQSTHGGLWLMAHPSETTEVTFELKPLKSGREVARELFARQLEKQTWRGDLETQRKALASKQTLLQMADALQSR